MSDPGVSLQPRVAMLLDEPFPPDARIRREAQALARAGYQVTLLCMHQPGQALDEVFGQGEAAFRVIRLPACKRDTARGLLQMPQTWIDNWAWRVTHQDKRWMRAAEPILAALKPDVLHLHDLRILPTGLALAKALSIKRTIADLHENYPALIASLQKNPVQAALKLKLWQQVEARYLPAASHIITVVEEAQERLVAAGHPAERITVIPNTVDTDMFLKSPPESLNLPESPEFDAPIGPNLVYIGHINAAHRGIQTVIDALPELLANYPDLKLILAGATQAHYREALEQQAQALGVDSAIIYTGKLTELAFRPYIQAATLCLCPHEKNEQTQATFPNKAYLYHLYAKPVLASDCIPLKRYMDQTEGGLTFEAGNPQDLARCVLTLLKNPNAAAQMGRNGEKAVLERFNWGQDAKRLVALYNALLA
ncbi:MAG: glycosyltransferase family 4 protein [Vampirovibrionales bacterium]|nr:glycosyltransferase family 4 protein [Vampirovibrionales bacterium]